MLKYYTITDEEQLLTAENEYALSRFYDNVELLPDDYEVGKYIVENGELVRNPNYEAEQELKEKERIAKLNMTRGDFIEGLILAQGKDENDIISLIEALPIEDVEKKVHINRVKNALDFYRGYPVIDVLCEYLNVPTENMTLFFETKNHAYLVPIDTQPKIEEDTHDEVSNN